MLIFALGTDTSVTIFLAPSLAEAHACDERAITSPELKILFWLIKEYIREKSLVPDKQNDRI